MNKFISLVVDEPSDLRAASSRETIWTDPYYTVEGYQRLDVKDYGKCHYIMPFPPTISEPKAKVYIPAANVDFSSGPNPYMNHPKSPLT